MPWRCEQDAGSRRAVPSYDDFSGRLVQLSADQNGDGRIDQWTYLDGNRPLRGEADLDADGRVDRWEYFDAQAALIPGRHVEPRRRRRRHVDAAVRRSAGEMHVSIVARCVIGSSIGASFSRRRRGARRGRHQRRWADRQVGTL